MGHGRVTSHQSLGWDPSLRSVSSPLVRAHTHSRDPSLRQADVNARTVDHLSGGHHTIPPSPRIRPPGSSSAPEDKILPVFSFV